MKLSEIYDDKEHLQSDLEDVAEWLNTTVLDLNIDMVQEPITIFEKSIKEMLNTYDEFPEDYKRTRRIKKFIEKTGKIYPIYVKKNDKIKFVMEGRHRMVAFLLLKMKTIPVAYVSSKREDVANTPQ